ncbi:PAS domain S-box-containing protein [Natrinema salaciae]|uniref:histidine kinase n=2 Tax=Natrinema salaciae TaxID=1186196 RepID=A0A1H9IF40_9EURY|nr:PAS domain S-box-containing protein [Natrinema salaciae]
MVSAIATVLVWRQRDSRADVWGAVAQCMAILWALVHLLSVSGDTLAWQRYWLLAFFPVLAMTITSMFCFTLYFTGRDEWFSSWRTRLLFSYPIATAVLSLTNGIHELVIVDPALESHGSYEILQYGWGPGFYAFAAVSYSIGVVYLSLLFLKGLRSRNVYRNLTFLIFASIAFLTVLTVFSATKKSPFPHFILHTIGYLFIGVVMIAATLSMRFIQQLPVDRFLSPFGSRFGSLVPLARDFVLEEIDNGVVVLDTNGRIVDINTTGKRMIGTDRAVGNHVSEVVHHDRIVDTGGLGGMLDGTQQLHAVQDELWIASPSGKRCYEVTVSELPGNDGVAAGYVVLLHDITDQKRRQQDLERQKADLETQKTKLEHQNEQLDRFAGIVSHDLRNPLNVANGYLADVSDRTGDDGETVTMEATTVEHVTVSLERMGDIIDDALALARQGRAITEFQDVRLSTVAREAWTNVDTGDATLELDCERSIQADPDRLLNVFENLFRNAVEHGSVASESEDLTISVGFSADGGFYVEDDGTGIPADRRSDIFDRGYTTSEVGTGFGLTIVRDIARAHGWEVAVTDGETGGTRFEFTGLEAARSDA